MIREAILDFHETIQTTHYKKQKKKEFEKKISHSFAQGKILLVDEKH